MHAEHRSREQMIKPQAGPRLMSVRHIVGRGARSDPRSRTRLACGPRSTCPATLLMTQCQQVVLRDHVQGSRLGLNVFRNGHRHLLAPRDRLVDYRSNVNALGHRLDRVAVAACGGNVRRVVLHTERGPIIVSRAFTDASAAAWAAFARATTTPWPSRSSRASSGNCSSDGAGHRVQRRHWSSSVWLAYCNRAEEVPPLAISIELNCC